MNDKVYTQMADFTREEEAISTYASFSDYEKLVLRRTILRELVGDGNYSDTIEEVAELLREQGKIAHASMIEELKGLFE